MTKKKKIDNTNVSKHLGQISEYKSSYDPKLLVREPRQSNREHLNINDNNLPFEGNDTWNAYEVSGLTNGGLPVVGIAKIVYPCTNQYIVESKSLKLYFNSFNMTKLGDTANDVRKEIKECAVKDLSALLETDVKVSIFSNGEVMGDGQFASSSEWGHNIPYDRSLEYVTLEEEYLMDGLNITQYQESPELLEVVDSESADVKYHSSLLKSNCRVTGQPDFGDVYIHIKKEGKTIDPVSMLKYITSFRGECHFHEEICETIYARIWEILKPDLLDVKCLYTRRGGIDICPQRVSHKHPTHIYLSDPGAPHTKTPRQ
jgi:7-cyano-7-deazaguanine reductase